MTDTSDNATRATAALAWPVYQRVEGGWKCGGPIGCGGVVTDLTEHSHGHGIRHEKFCAECKPGETDV